MKDKIKQVFEQRIKQEVAALMERAEIAIAQNLFEKGDWLSKTKAGGDLTKVKTKADEKRMEKDVKLLGATVAFKAPEITSLRHKGYVPAVDDDNMVLVSRDTEEGEAAAFTVLKYKSKRDGTFTYMLVYNMPVGDAKKYEIYTDIEQVPMWKDAKRTWVKAKQPTAKEELAEEKVNEFTIIKKEAIVESFCSMCGGKCGDFKNEESLKEHDLSGMCQTCQDKIFG